MGVAKQKSNKKKKNLGMISVNFGSTNL